MNKQSLTIGNVAEFRNGQRALIICSNPAMNLQFLFSSGGIIDLNDEMIDFTTLLSKTADKYDVMKIYSTNEIVRRLSDIGNQGNLQLIEERAPEPKLLKLVQFDKEGFKNAHPEIQLAFSGLGEIEEFHKREEYFLIENPGIVGRPDLDAGAERAFKEELQRIMDGRVNVQDSIISICCRQDNKAFKYAYRFRLNVTNVAEFANENDNKDTVNILCWFNSDRLLELFKKTEEQNEMGGMGDLALGSILGSIFGGIAPDGDNTPFGRR